MRAALWCCALCFELTDSSARGWIISDSLSGKQTAESYTTSKHQVNVASERWHHIYKANAGTFRLASGLELAEKLSGFLEPALHVLVGSHVTGSKENLGNWTLDRFPFIMLFDGTQTQNATHSVGCQTLHWCTTPVGGSNVLSCETNWGHWTLKLLWL